LLDTAVAGTTSITVDADITLSTTTGASNEARQAIILWNPASGTTTRNITAPAQSKLYTVINASGGTQSIVIRGAGPTTGVTIAKGESAQVAWNGSDFVKVGSSGGAITFTNLTVTGNTVLGDAAADTLTVNATSTFAAPVSFQGLVNLPSTGRSAAAALTPTNPAFLYGVASTYTDTTSSGTLAPVATFYSLARPTLSTSNVTTYTSAATLYIANAPAAAGSATITNPYALYIAAGNMYFGGSVASNLLFVDNTYDIGASGATRPRNLYTSGIGVFGGTLFTQSLAIGNARIQIRDNSIEEYSTDADSLVAVNYTGYLAGTTRFRDFDIYNGKNGFIATFDGATSRFGLGNANPSYVFDMTGQGRVLSGSGSSGATIPANNLFVVDSNANTGMGLCIPSTGGIVGGFYVNAGANTYDGGIEYQGTTRVLNLRSAGVNNVIIDSVGTVGVGVTPNTWNTYKALQIGNGSIANYTPTQDMRISSNVYNNSGFKYIANAYATQYLLDGSAGEHQFFSAVSGTAGSAISFNRVMTISNAGNVEIGGVFALGRKLNVDSSDDGYTMSLLQTGAFNSGKTSGIVFPGYYDGSSITDMASIRGGKENTTSGNFGGKLAFYTRPNGGSDTQRADIDSTGKLTVGTTSTSLSNLLTALSNVASGGSTMTVHNFNDSGSGVTYAGINFLVGSDTGTCSIRSIRTNAGVDYQSALQFLTNPAGATIVPTLKMTINSTGAVVLAGGTTSASGTGITFPASQNQSSNANTLDDYEEGSWTPLVQFGGSSTGVTYTYRTGTYVKIGRQVTVWVTFYLSNKGSSTGDFQIAGLPYQPDQTFYNEEYGTAGEINNLTFSGYLAARVGGSAAIAIFQFTSGAAQTILSNTNFTDGTSMACTVTYTTNA
jgi:hypothetical protein